jgi:hypothetical protein
MLEVDPKIDVVYCCRVALKSEGMDFEDLTCYFPVHSPPISIKQTNIFCLSFRTVDLSLWLWVRVHFVEDTPVCLDRRVLFNVMEDSR